MLKAYNLIHCIPSNFCLERGQFASEPSRYWLVEKPAHWNCTPNFNFEKRKVYHVSTHVDYDSRALAV